MMIHFEMCCQLPHTSHTSLTETHKPQLSKFNGDEVREPITASETIIFNPKSIYDFLLHLRKVCIMKCCGKQTTNGPTGFKE